MKGFNSKLMAQRGALHLLAPLIIAVLCGGIWLYRERIRQLTTQQLIIEELQQKVEELEGRVLKLER